MRHVVKNRSKADILADVIAGLDFGCVISHAEISDIIKESRNTTKYTSIVQRAKKTLIQEYGKVLESIRGEGYRVIMPDDYVNHSLKHYKRGMKEFNKGNATLDAAPTKYMSEEGRTAHRYVSERATILNASLKGGVVELKTLGEKKHPFLPEKVGRR